jgi:hypothetical protein
VVTPTPKADKRANFRRTTKVPSAGYPLPEPKTPVYPLRAAVGADLVADLDLAEPWTESGRERTHLERR